MKYAAEFRLVKIDEFHLKGQRDLRRIGMKAKKAKEYVFNDLLGMESYCRSHYAEYYSKSNFSCNVTQLTKGELLTSSICAPINDVHLELFKSNHTDVVFIESIIGQCWVILR